MGKFSALARVCRALALGATFTAVASPALAQSPATSFGDLRLLVKPGDSVTVTDAAGHEVTGRITEISTSTLTVAPSHDRAATTRYRWTEAEVATIRQRRHDSLINGTLIGAAVGGGLGIVGAAQCGGGLACAAAAGSIVLFGLGIGAGVGLGLDAAITTRRVIYQRPSPASAVPGEPRRTGVLLTFRF